MSTTEVGVAYVRLLPSMDGFASAVKSEMGDVLTRQAREAGEDAGKAMARGIEDGASGADLDGFTSSFGDKLKLGLGAAGLAGGALLIEGFTSAMDLEATTKKLEAQLGGGEFAEAAGKSAADLYAQGFGGSVADTADAVRQLFAGGLIDESATKAEIDSVTGSFLTFSDVMEQDMDSATRAVSSMIDSGIADSSTEALDVLTRGLQLGGDKAGDLLDTFGEYSTMFREVGIDAEEAMGLMVQGLDAGADSSDRVADAIKEFGIRAQDGSKLSADGFKAIGLSAEDMTAKVAKGGPEAREALDQVLDGLRNIEDPVARNAAAVALFGTQAEDLGDALYSLDLTTAADGLGNVAGAATDLGSAYDTASANIENFKRGALMGLTEFIGGTVLPGLESLWAKFGPDITAAVTAVGDAITEVKDSFSEFWTALNTGMTQDEGGTWFEDLGLTIHDVLQRAQPVLDTFKRTWQEFMNFVTSNPEVARGILIGLGVALATVAAALAAVAAAVIAATVVFGAIAASIAYVAGLLVGHAGPAFAAAKTAVSTLGAAVGATAGVVRSGISEIVGFFRNLPGQISSAMSSLANAITAPFRSAFNAVKSAWNSTVGGFSISLPKVFGFGGASFSIPRMHSGGIFDAPAGGSEGLALLKKGEGVFTPDQMAAIGSSSAPTAARPAVVELHADGVDRALLEWLRRSIRVEGGGDVQLALGRG